MSLKSFGAANLSNKGHKVLFVNQFMEVFSTVNFYLLVACGITSLQNHNCCNGPAASKLKDVR